LLALPFAALLFRRGWLACLALFALGATLPPPALAFDWPDLWRRADQQAAQAFERAGAGDEARLLEKLGPGSPWRAMVLYRAGRYAEAEALLAAQDTADAHYNRGNALALAGQLEQALEAYDAALARRPGMSDALHNRALVRQALAKQRAQGPDGDRSEAEEPAQAQPPAPGTPSRSRKRETDRDEPGRPEAQARTPPPEGTQPAEESPERAELRRLEELLLKVPDDSGSLLANRFAHQLRLRGTPHRDTGARW
jgi:Ca-activated chloride channel family protein